MTEVVFGRENGWFPRVVRDEGVLRIELGAGADANHDPRTFTFPVEEAQVAVIREDLRRHLLLWSAILPLCDAAGTRGALDEDAAVALLDPILFSAPGDVDALFRRIRWDRSRLVAHGADVALLERGEVWAATGSAGETADWARAQEHQANRWRAQRGVVLAPLDTAILKYTGQYLHGATVPQRRPEAVDRALLPEVLDVIAAGERAASGLRIGRDPRRGSRGTDKRDWERMGAAVETAVRGSRPELADDAVASVKFLICSEAAGRARSTPYEEGGAARSTKLIFTDDKDAEETWRSGGSRTAAEAFWEFVEARSAGDNEVFTIEDEAAGEGLQLHFYADSVARITTVSKGAGEPKYQVEYSLVDGMDGYRAVVGAFITGGCAALDAHGPWLTNAEFERTRRERKNRR
ncbi:DUF6357 family protein [Kribbella sp. NPDC051770]|uniref:DUF6357 family protein n=1 Tax=Kribbella sp. NPDC051770 TaxID=3155413 RepID=UPI00341258C0